MSAYPYTLRPIALKAPRLKFEQHTSWQALARSDGLVTEFVMNTATRALASEFAYRVAHSHEIHRSENEDGVTMHVTCYALTYRELMDLLYDAYTEGQRDAMLRAPLHDRNLSL